MSATLVTPKTTSGGEIIRELVNATDGQGLHFDTGRIDFASPPDLGTKFSYEFIIQVDAVGDEQGIIDFYTGGRLWFGIHGSTGKLAFYDTDYRDFSVLVLDDLKVHHLVMTVDGTAATLYDNGNQVSTVTLGRVPDVDDCTDAMFPNTAFDGTIYRARLWNKTLTATEVTTAYENATVNFADQWVGAATNMITGAVDKNWGTAQADSGNDATDRATFNTNYTWNTDGNITDISVASNVLQFTSASSGTSGLWYPTGTIVAGKRYRIIIRTGAITGGDFKVRVSTGSYVDLATLTASSTNVIDFVAPKSVLNYIYINSSDAGATIQLNAASVSNELFRAGVVADYDLAFANPTQSLTVQDRAGAADGTASSGVTQVTKIEAVNTNKLSVGGTVPRVGIGLAAGTAPDSPLQVYGNDASASTQVHIHNDQTGHAAVLKLQGGRTGDNDTAQVQFANSGEIISAINAYRWGGNDVGEMRFLTSASGTSGLTARMTITSAGQVDIGGSWKFNANGTGTWGETSNAAGITWDAGEAIIYAQGSNALMLKGETADGIAIPSTGGVYEVGGVLKENLLTNSGFDCWSNSTLENIATIEEDDCASDDTGDWATQTRMTLAFDTDHYTYTATGTANTAAITSVDYTGGKLYKLTVDIAGSDASVTSTFQLWARAGSVDSYSPEITTTASFVTHTLVVEADSTTTSGFVGLYDATDFSSAGHVKFKNFKLTEVTPGCVAANNLAMDGWAKDSGADLYRQYNDGGTLTHDGSFYALKAEGTAAHYVQQPNHVLDRVAEWTSRFEGRTVTFGCWVKASNASTAKVCINENGSREASGYHTGGGGWEWLEVTDTMSATVTRFCVELMRDTANTVYYSQPMLVFGSAIGEGNYSRPQGEVINLEKFVEIQTNVTPAAADDKILNLEALSNGKIPKGAKAIHSLVEVKNSSIASGQGIRFGPTSTYPYQLVCCPQVDNIYLQSSGRINCDTNGDIYQQVTETGATLSGLYHNINTVVLR